MPGLIFGTAVSSSPRCARGSRRRLPRRLAQTEQVAAHPRRAGPHAAGLPRKGQTGDLCPDPRGYQSRAGHGPRPLTIRQRPPAGVPRSRSKDRFKIKGSANWARCRSGRTRLLCASAARRLGAPRAAKRGARYGMPSRCSRRRPPPHHCRSERLQINRVASSSAQRSQSAVALPILKLGKSLQGVTECFRQKSSVSI